jgi:hypothetical protein
MTDEFTFFRLLKEQVRKQSSLCGCHPILSPGNGAAAWLSWCHDVNGSKKGLGEDVLNPASASYTLIVSANEMAHNRVPEQLSATDETEPATSNVDTTEDLETEEVAGFRRSQNAHSLQQRKISWWDQLTKQPNHTSLKFNTNLSG